MLVHRDGSRMATAGDSSAGEDGFTLVAMMVIMAVMAIALTVAVQTVSFQKKRENEQELIFRGGQFVEGVRLFRARQGRFPITLDELVKAKPRVLRKKWVDPVTGSFDWVPVFFGQEGQPVTTQPGGTAGGEGPTPTPTPVPTPSLFGLPNQTTARGPIVGVRSPSCETSIKVYNGHTRYCDWKFFYDARQQKTNPAPPDLQPLPGH
jgi:type II secretory pathway pseudopilin PulG